MPVPFWHDGGARERGILSALRRGGFEAKAGSLTEYRSLGTHIKKSPLVSTFDFIPAEKGGGARAKEETVLQSARANGDRPPRRAFLHTGLNPPGGEKGFTQTARRLPAVAQTTHHLCGGWWKNMHTR